MSIEEQLEQLYAELPVVECQGHCWNSCGPIAMSEFERERIRQRGVEIDEFTRDSGRAWAAGAPLYCAALTKDHRCSVYEVRPLICRAWGVGRADMACRHGCEVSAKRLKGTEILAMLIRSYQIGGFPGNLDCGDVDLDVLTDPELAPLLVRYLQGDRGVEPELALAAHRARQRLTNR